MCVVLAYVYSHALLTFDYSCLTRVIMHQRCQYSSLLRAVSLCSSFGGSVSLSELVGRILVDMSVLDLINSTDEKQVAREIARCADRDVPLAGIRCVAVHFWFRTQRVGAEGCNLPCNTYAQLLANQPNLVVCKWVQVSHHRCGIPRPISHYGAASSATTRVCPAQAS